MIFVDTSAFYALAQPDDPNHRAADELWQRFAARRERLCTTNYVVLETSALLQSRLSLALVRSFHAELLPLVEQHFIDAPLHGAAVELLVTANRRKLSLVDATSFLFMRRAKLSRAFAFDKHFGEFGFETAF